MLTPTDLTTLRQTIDALEASLRAAEADPPEKTKVRDLLYQSQQAAKLALGLIEARR